MILELFVSCKYSGFFFTIFTWIYAGPSYGIQGSDAASGLALEKAYQSVLTEECETAIVAGTSLCLKKANMTYLNRNLISKHGLCQPFDEDGE